LHIFVLLPHVANKLNHIILKTAIQASVTALSTVQTSVRQTNKIAEKRPAFDL